MNRSTTLRGLLLVVALMLSSRLSLVDEANAIMRPVTAVGPAATLGTGITYEGALLDNGTPANGVFDFQFALYDQPEGGAQLANAPVAAVQVSDGYFKVTLDFAQDVFTGEGRWLLIQVRRSGADEDYTALTPRQPLLPVPYALALPGLWTRQNDISPNLIGGAASNVVVGGVWGATIGGGGTAWNPNHVSDNYGVIAGGEGNRTGNDDSDFENAEFSTVGGGLGNRAEGWGATVGGGHENWAAGDYNATIGGGQGNTASANVTTISGGGSNQASNHYATVAGGGSNVASGNSSTIGGGQNNRAEADYATVDGGAANRATAFAATVGGGRRNEANADHSVVAGGFWNVTFGITSTISGGQQNFINHDYATIGGGRNNQIYADYGTVGGGGGEDSAAANIVYDDFGTIAGGSSNRAGSDNDNRYDAIYATVGGGYNNRAGASFATVGGGDFNNAWGLGATVAGGYHNTASGRDATVPGGAGNWASGDYSFAAGYQAQAKHEGAFVWADHVEGRSFESTAPGQFLISAGGGVGIGTNSPQAMLDVAGRTRTDVLEIDGGLDLAERFEITGGQATLPGMAVVIDPAHPGHLRVSDQPYDRLVAGCISGANGVNPGLVMAQDGIVGDESVPVALAGRVYCYADAAYGPIQPGDLLTTSATPGHLMAAHDHGEAQGAIVGKAMSRLAEGRGFVLVLVSLQ